MKSRKTMLALMGVALVLAGTLDLVPALARPYWYEPTEDGEDAPPYQHRYVNGTLTWDETLQPPCWDPETGEYTPRYNGTQPDWCPYEDGQTGQRTGDLGGMWRNWSDSRGGIRQGSGGFRRGGGCG